MAQGVDFETLSEALAACPQGVGAAECHGQICALLCGGIDAQHLDALLERWAWNAKAEVNPNVLTILSQIATESRLALEDTNLTFAPLLPVDAVSLDARVSALAEWAQGFLYGLVEVGTVGPDAPEAVHEVIADFAEIARLRGGGLDDEDDEGAYAELVEYVRMGALLVYGERAPDTDAGGRQE